MRMDVYHQTIVGERGRCVRQLLGTVEGDTVAHCKRIAWIEYFDRDELWFRRCGRVVPHRVKVRLVENANDKMAEKDNLARYLEEEAEIDRES